MEKVIIIMATSAKHDNFCVGGIDVETGEWIRLVSDDEIICGALTQEMITFETGEKCSPLDKIEVSLIKEVSMGHQSENFLIDTSKKFKKIKKVSLEDALQIHPIENECIDVKGFFKNELPYFDIKEIQKIKRSLYLIEVKNLKIYKNDHYKYKSSFEYLGKNYYDISITDPDYFSSFDCSYNRAIIILSLPNKAYLEKYYYKFVVKVFPLVDKNEFLF